MCCLDAIYSVMDIPKEASKVLATAYVETGGGMAANASVAVARLGGTSEFWGRVGTDWVGDCILAELAAEGVDVTHVKRVQDGRSSSSAVLVTPSGERTVVAYNDPRLDLEPEWLPLGRIGVADAVLADIRWRAGALAILTAAQHDGVPAVLDADTGPQDVVLELGRLANYIMFSAAGLESLVGPGDAGAALRRAAREFTGTVGVTLGADGFLWLDREAERWIPAPPVRAIDTLAAGDVWHGSFALEIAEGQPVANAARFANAAAALKCSRPGGRKGAPRRREVEQLLATTPG
jgi:sulfofructose kinase